MTIESILSKVSDATHVSVKDIIGKRRFRAVATARHLSIYLSRKYNSQLSLSEIGNQHGNRDHTTVLHAISKIETLREIYIDIEILINQLENEIDAERFKNLSN